MKKRITLWLLATLLLANVSLAEAQQQAKVAKIGWLSDRSASDPAGPALALFRRELRALDYVEAKNIAIEYRSTENKPDRLPALADELVRLKVDVLFAPSTNMALARQKRYQDDPYRFCRLRGSRCSRTGRQPSAAWRKHHWVDPPCPVLVGKRLELLKETFPKVARVA